MSYYLESEGLNLNKVYTNLNYTKLTPSLVSEKDKKTPVSQEMITQHTYFFVQEKDAMIEDANHLSLHFKKKFVEKSEENRGEDFPFVQVHNRLCFYVQQYQEDPILLDQIIEQLVSPLMESVKEYFHLLLSKKENTFLIPEHFELLVRNIYLLCKVRGHKQISKYFPHEVKDLEAVVYFLNETKRRIQWETQFVALLWLSMIVLVPFPLHTIDSSLSFKNDKSLVENLMDLGIEFLNSPNKLRDVAAFFLSQLFSRQDVLALGHLEKFVEWAVKESFELKKDEIKLFALQGVYCALFEIFKNGQRKDLLKLLPQAMSLTNLEENSESQPIANAPAIRHFKAKLSQRLALVSLHKCKNTWAYRKANKRVKSRRHVGVNAHTNGTQMEEEFNAEGVEFNYIEEILDLLINLLRDKETAVRWSAAKGLGRISERLEQEMAEDVLNMILDLFSPHETDASWHGASLALAEMMKRGLLLPGKIKEMFPLALKALLYDVPQGNVMLGSNVRDSACYIVWCIARAYTEDIISPYLLQLAQSLLCVALFDKEVSCRRAASAAFQECVGRLGNIPHGIPVLTEADYFTVGIRAHSFLRVGVYVASFPEYFECLVMHLVKIKLENLDEEVRNLASATLSLLTPINPQFMVKSVIPILIEKCQNKALHIMHGGFLGLSEVILGLAGLSELNQTKDEFRDSIFLKRMNFEEKKLMKAGEYLHAYEISIKEVRRVNNVNLLTQETLAKILSIIAEKRKDAVYKGKSGETLKSVFSRFVECCSLAKIPLSKDNILELSGIFEDAIRCPNILANDSMRDSSISSMRVFSSVYFQSDDEAFESVLRKFMFDAVKDPVQTVKQGFTLALGSFSPFLISKHFTKIFEVLEENSIAKEMTAVDPVLRSCAIKTIVPLVSALSEISPQIVEKAFTLCFKGMEDYTVDKRGDIGSVVREASMNSQLELIKKLSGKSEIPSKFLFQFIGNCLQQLMEKIDKIRLVAGFTLQDFFINCSSISQSFPCKEQLQTLFSEENIKSIWSGLEEESFCEYMTLVQEAAVQLNETISWVNYPWNQPNMVFPIITPLLELTEYAPFILKGLVVSVGGLTESIQKAALNALQNFLLSTKQKPGLVKAFLEKNIELLKAEAGNERIIIPFFKTLELIFELDGVFISEDLTPLFKELRECIVNELRKWKSTNKILNAIGALNGLMSVSSLEIKRDCVKTVRRLLTHKYPTVRKLMADKFYMFLMIHGEFLYGEESNEEIMEMIIETNWNELSVEDLKAIVESLPLIKE